MSDLILIIFSAALVNNIVVLEIIGADPALGFFRRMEVAKGLGITMLVLMPLVTISCYLVNIWLLTPLNINYIQLPVMVFVILLITGCIRQWGHYLNNNFHSRIKIFLPFAGINITVLGVVLLNQKLAHGFLLSLAFALGSAIGFFLILLIMTACTERLEVSDVPAPFRGLPIVLLTLALISMAFMGFNGMTGN